MKTHSPSLALFLLVALRCGAELVPVAPVDGETVPLVPDVQKKVMSLPTLAERIDLFREDRKTGKVLSRDKTWRKSRPLVLSWKGTAGEAGPWKIEIGREPDLTDSRAWYIRAKDALPPAEEGADKDAAGPDGEFSCTLPRANLEIARTYYWRVTGRESADSKTLARSAIASFRTEDLAPRWIMLEGDVRNMRDLGGRRTLDGRRVRQGMVFRGQGLNENSITGEVQGRNRLTVEDLRYLTGMLGIRTDLDLRSPGETADLAESPLGPGVKFILRSSPAYKVIFLYDHDKESMAANFRVFCDPANYPIYFHCIAGADRTGTLGYVLNGVLGVDRHELETDWEATFYPNIPDDIHEDEPDFWQRESHFSDGFAKYGGPDDSWARRIELYLLDIGVTQEEIDRFRSIMLEP